MAKHPLISIPFDIPDVRVLQTELTKDGELILTVESALTSTTCRRCGRTITEQHGEDRPRLLRHLPILGRVVYLRIRPKRFRCPWCDDHPTTTQQLDWYDPNALHTKAYERHLIVQLINSTLSDVEAKEDVSYDALLGILDRWIAKCVEWDSLPPFATIGIDEIALLKGHRDFVAVISGQTAHGDVYVLAVLPDRLKPTVVAWLKTIPAAIRTQITTVCTETITPVPLPVELIGQLNGFDGSGVAIKGSYAYVADSTGSLRVINISNPANPSLITSLALPSPAHDVVVVGNYAYVADDADGLRIINISNPASPSVIGFVNTPGQSQGVAVAGNYAYVADVNGGLRIISITDPANPHEIGFYHPSSPAVWYAYDVAIAGNYAYVPYITTGGGGLSVINIATQTSPFEEGSVTTPGTAFGVVSSSFRGERVY